MTTKEQAPTDTECLDWVLDILSIGTDDSKTDQKALAIAGTIMLGKKGREAIYEAMKAVA